MPTPQESRPYWVNTGPGTIPPLRLSNRLSYPSTPPDIVRRSRERRRVFLQDGARVVLPILLVTGSVLGLLILSDWQQRRVRREALSKAKATMAPATAPAGLARRATAAGNQGLVLDIADGSWIVIRHEALPDGAEGVTVALDSGGQWRVTEELRTGQMGIGIFSEAQAARTLAEAREKLRQLGFRVTSP